MQARDLSGKLGNDLSPVLPADRSAKNADYPGNDDHVPLARDLDSILADIKAANDNMMYILEALQL